MNLTYLMRELQMAKKIFKDQKGVHMTIKGSFDSSRKKTNTIMETPSKR